MSFASFYFAIFAPLTDGLLSNMQTLFGEFADCGVRGQAGANQLQGFDHFGGCFSAHDYATFVV